MYKILSSIPANNKKLRVNIFAWCREQHCNVYCSLHCNLLIINDGYSFTVANVVMNVVATILINLRYYKTHLN